MWNSCVRCVKIYSVLRLHGEAAKLCLLFEDTKSSGDSEKSKKVKADYEKQLQKMKQEMGKLQVGC